MAELIEKQVDGAGPTILPNAEIQAKAEAIRSKRELPKPPGRGCTFTQFCDWLKLLTTDMEQRIMVYVYRHKPIINRQLVNPDLPNYIDVITDGYKTLDESFIIDRHGGGTYGLMVVDTDRGGTKKDGTYFEVKLDVPMGQHPPKLDLREVDWSEPKNTGYKAWAMGQRLIDVNGVPISEAKAQQAANNGNSGDTAATLKLMLDFASKMSDKEQAAFRAKMGEGESLGKGITDIMLEKMKQEDPNKQLTTMSTLIQAMKPTGEGGLTAIIPMFVAMMNTQMESSKQTMLMLVEVMKANKAEPQPEGKDSITQLKDLLEVARELKGGNSGRSNTEVIVDKVMDLATPVLGIIGQVMAMKAHAAGVQGIPVAPGGPSQGQGSTPPPTGSPQAPQTRVNALIQQAGATPKQNGDSVTDHEVGMIRQFAPLILQNMSKEGWEFGAWISDGFGDPIAASVARQGVDKLLAGLKAIPELWSQIEATYGEEYAKKWVASLCNYKEELGKLEGEGEGEEVPDAS
jgi:hypothetical protein